MSVPPRGYLIWLHSRVMPLIASLSQSGIVDSGESTPLMQPHPLSPPSPFEDVECENYCQMYPSLRLSYEMIVPLKLRHESFWMNWFSHVRGIKELWCREAWTKSRGPALQEGSWNGLTPDEQEEGREAFRSILRRGFVAISHPTSDGQECVGVRINLFGEGAAEALVWARATDGAVLGRSLIVSIDRINEPPDGAQFPDEFPSGFVDAHLRRLRMFAIVSSAGVVLVLECKHEHEKTAMVEGIEALVRAGCFRPV